MQVLNHNIENF